MSSRQCRTQCSGSALTGGQISTKSGNGSVSEMGLVEVGVGLESPPGRESGDDDIAYLARYLNVW
jgi:hypothetical protein